MVSTVIRYEIYALALKYCEHCMGSGVLIDEFTKPCRHCEGTGKKGTFLELSGVFAPNDYSVAVAKFKNLKANGYDPQWVVVSESKEYSYTPKTGY